MALLLILMKIKMVVVVQKERKARNLATGQNGYQRNFESREPE